MSTAPNWIDIEYGGINVASEGDPLPTRPTVNYKGDGVEVVDNEATNSVDVTISAAAQQLETWPPVVAASPTNINTAAATHTVDGFSVSPDDRVGLVGQTTSSQNGIYVVQSDYTLARASDADASADMRAGRTFFAQHGAVNRGTFVLVTPAPVTIGSTGLLFVRQQASVALAAIAGALGLAPYDVTTNPTVDHAPALTAALASGAATVLVEGGPWRLASVVHLDRAVIIDGHGGTLYLAIDQAFSADSNDVHWRRVRFAPLVTLPLATGDGHIAMGATTLTSASAPFTSAAGKLSLIIKGAGVAGADLETTIASFTSTTEVEVADPADTTVTTATITTGRFATLLARKTVGVDTLYHCTGWAFDHCVFDGIECIYSGSPREDSLDTFMQAGATSTDVEAFVELHCEHTNLRHIAATTTSAVLCEGITDGWFIRCWIHDNGDDDGFTGDDAFTLVSQSTNGNRRGGVNLIHCTIERTARNAISAYDASRTSILDCTIRDNGVGAIDDTWNDLFASLIPSDRLIVRGCRISGHSASGGFGIKCGGPYSVVEHNELDDNETGIFSVPSQGGALLATNGNRITGNTIRGGNYGILTNNSDAYVAGNTCTDNAVAGIAETAAQALGAWSSADGHITNGGHTLTSATAAFKATDVGAALKVPGAGAAAADLITTIATYTSATSVDLTDAAGTTVTTATIYHYTLGSLRTRFHGNSGTLYLGGTDAQVRDHAGAITDAGTRSTVNGLGSQSVSSGTSPTNASSATPPSAWRAGDIIAAGGNVWRYDGTVFNPLPYNSSGTTHVPGVSALAFDIIASNGQADFNANGGSFLTVKVDAFADTFLKPPDAAANFFVGNANVPAILYGSTVTIGTALYLVSDASFANVFAYVLNSAGASSRTIAGGVTSWADSWAQKSGTGATAGASRSLEGQQGQQQTGGSANNNGGLLDLIGGAAGTGGGGAAGVRGEAHLRGSAAVLYGGAAATTERVRGDATGLGFFGHATAAQPTISGALSTVADAPAKAVLTSIIAALVALGLATDGTT